MPGPWGTWEGLLGDWQGAISLSRRDKPPRELLNALVSREVTEWLDHGPGMLFLALRGP